MEENKMTELKEEDLSTVAGGDTKEKRWIK